MTFCRNVYFNPFGEGGGEGRPLLLQYRNEKKRGEEKRGGCSDVSFSADEKRRELSPGKAPDHFLI